MQKSPVIDEFYSIESAVTPIQSGDFNYRLNSLATNIKVHQLEESLPSCLSDEHISQYLSRNYDTQADFSAMQEKIYHNWFLLLNHLCRVLLPEMYVFFHDSTCNSEHRKEIHHQVDILARKFQSWTKYSPIQLQMITQNRPEVGNQVDDYVIGKGNNANVACNLLSLAALSRIHGDQYLNDLAPLMQIIMDNDKLIEFLIQDWLEVISQLEHWSNARITNFSQLSAEMLQKNDQLLCNNSHPLIKHLQHHANTALLQTTHLADNIQENTDSVNHSCSTNNSAKQAAVINNKQNSNKQSNHQQSNHQPNNKALVRTSTQNNSNHQQNSYVLLNVAAIASICVCLIALVISFVATTFIITTIAMITAVVSMGFVGVVAWQRVQQQKQIIAAPAPFADSAVLTDNSANNAVNNQKNTADLSLSNILPIGINRHAYHLSQLVSDTTLNHLKSVISAINQTHSYLEYLEEHHCYLASSVHELIMDISVNSIIRLNQQAKNFVKQGRVDDNIKNVFIQQQDCHVQQLLQTHLTEITALNESILAKQMAGFAHVGSESERQFRDTVMELKILLNWFVAQADDGIVCGYTMMQQKLESEMLVKMEEVYYKHDTSSEQRTELQRQVDELLAYFKTQSPKTEHDPLDENLLRLTDSSVLHQSETQQFIDFNKHYVKQLKQHW